MILTIILTILRQLSKVILLPLEDYRDFLAQKAKTLVNRGMIFNFAASYFNHKS
jgi:hypothetical protein